MREDTYRKNLQVLQATRPQLAATVDAACPDPSRYRLIETPSGLSSLEYIDEHGKSILWHSRHDPMREVQRELSAIDHSRIYLPLFAGIGLGYGLRTMWNNFRHEFFDAIVLEPDAAIFRLALHAVRLDDILADPRLHIQIGTDRDEWMDLVRKLISSIMSSSLQWLPHAPSLKCHETFFHAVLSDLQQQIQLTQAEFDLLTRSGPRIQENMWKNLPAIVSSMRLDSIRGCLQGKPAIVIAAGPSLDKNVQQLRGVEDSFALIAVDTAYRTLQQNHIEPHIVVTTDPTELNAKHFEGVVPNSQTILAFDPEVYYTIPADWPYRRLFLNLEKAAYTRWLEQTLGPFGYLPKGGSVGHTAFYLARALGANPIIFMGLDLAFDPQGGTTHTAGSALHRAFSSIENGAKTALLGPRYGADSLQENIVWVPGIQGTPVPTSAIMSLYIRQFSDEFARTPARRIDATEGGALLPDTEIMPLNQAIALFQTTGGMQEIVKKLPAPTVHPARVLQEIEPIASALTQAESTARQGQALVFHLSHRITEGSALRNTSEWTDMESRFSSLYQSEEIKIALEQALFSAVYRFIQKERLDQVDLRLYKYAQYFNEVLSALPLFSEIILRVKSDLNEN